MSWPASLPSCPLFVTYLIFRFLLGALAKAGLPVVQFFAAIFPRAWLSQPLLQSVLAILLTLVVLYVVGRVTSLVIGRQAFGLFESILERLPFVAKVYTSVRQLLDSMMAKKETSQRVVLVDFPIAGQKSIGFLTRTMSDAATGRPLAAVLVPNAINPTSAFLQILLMDRVTETDLTHGTGDEHGDDGRRGGAGDDSVFARRAALKRRVIKPPVPLS